ncbi:MAG: nucleoside hydrolase [Ilumatobacteraceae bacterium]
MNTNNLRFKPVRFIISAVVLITPLIAGCSSENGGAVSDSVESIPVLLDYSPTLSDAGALLYLASNPKVELVAVTLPGTGEADCEPGVRTTRSLLKIVKYGDIPVGCGRNTPLIANRDWPEEWRTEVNKWGAEMLPAVKDSPILDAEQLMADTLAAATTPLTIVAVGPLTNLGVVLAARPELSKQIARIVIMGGAVTVPGNVEKSPAAEWNIYIDPEAARRVIAAGIAVTLVPLDATNHVPWTERLLRRLATLDQPAAHTVYQMAASRTSLAGFYFWDELAAMAAIESNLVTVESMTVKINNDGAVVRDPAGYVVDVAVDANANAAIDEFLRTLNGGTLAEIVRLNPVELDYMIAMNNADSRSGIALGDAYDSLDNPDADPRELAAAFIGHFVDAIEALATDVSGLIPPSALVEAHADYVKYLGQFVARRNELLSWLAKAEGANPGELLDDATKKSGLEDSFVDIRQACQVLEDYSFLHDGPRPCSSAADG